MTEIRTIGVVGAGFMGSGIAESAAKAGVPVVVYEPWPEALDGARHRLDQSVGTAVRRGKMSDEDAAALHGRITYTSDLDALSEVDLAVEAIVEQIDLKQDVFTKLDRVLPDHALLASNTSSIPISQLAAVTGRSDRVCGLHFFSPVPVMRLVEVVIALDTSEDTVAVADAFTERLGKKPIHTQDRSGFIVNFLLIPYLTAAVRMYQDGFATREDIDEGMKLGCGHPMGPLTLCDFIGLDVMYAICESLFDEFKQPEYAPPPLLKRMVAANRLGRKTGRGFYEYA